MPEVQPGNAATMTTRIRSAGAPIRHLARQRTAVLRAGAVLPPERRALDHVGRILTLLSHFSYI